MMSPNGWKMMKNEQIEMWTLPQQTPQEFSIDKLVSLDDVFRSNLQLEMYFHNRLINAEDLNRKLVSFQANKKVPIYRWYKYKEGFSAGLVASFIKDSGFGKDAKVLDPFAGAGTSLFVAKQMGMQSVGIELLPIGQQIIKTRELIETQFDVEDLVELKRWANDKPWRSVKPAATIPELKITRGAYPPETVLEIGQYLTALQSEEEKVQKVLRFALLCVLEGISFTRKDGQYLRWDHRSNRGSSGNSFDKGEIENFSSAISSKLMDIVSDTIPCISTPSTKLGSIELLSGSCLSLLPLLDKHQFDLVITSPPYCNRYDYTRTYALELAMLGVSESELACLRQEMLSCTVENRVKDLLAINPKWENVIQKAEDNHLLSVVLSYLERQKELNLLNNKGIPRMMRGYFYEMACVIHELHRVLRPGGQVYMVNDNVRYAGASISVDLILSKLAEDLGFTVEKILVLPNGKGNSSQQMGEHGRIALRKCVYVWKKNNYVD